MPASAAAYRAAVPVFAALGDDVRLSLVRQLGSGGPVSLAELCDGRTITRQAVSKHLKVLTNAGLVQAEKRGRESIFALRPAQVDAARAALDAISHEWDRRVERLRRFVEE